MSTLTATGGSFFGVEPTPPSNASATNLVLPNPTATTFVSQTQTPLVTSEVISTTTMSISITPIPDTTHIADNTSAAAETLLANTAVQDQTKFIIVVTLCGLSILLTLVFALIALIIYLRRRKHAASNPPPVANSGPNKPHFFPLRPTQLPAEASSQRHEISLSMESGNFDTHVLPPPPPIPPVRPARPRRSISPSMLAPEEGTHVLVPDEGHHLRNIPARNSQTNTPKKFQFKYEYGAEELQMSPTSSYSGMAKSWVFDDQDTSSQQSREQRIGTEGQRVREMTTRARTRRQLESYPLPLDVERIYEDTEPSREIASGRRNDEYDEHLMVERRLPKLHATRASSGVFPRF